ncbi:MAG: DNA translocase FtsK [Scytonematopsis contorta HA4267-MV1]|jgi:S-DNA-T family DNA segregation ATPase FtsK/SpoIIIE|nr:DNA translocase FtsK [Scytonematopsis contorta HA4267-MV1]
MDTEFKENLTSIISDAKTQGYGNDDILNVTNEYFGYEASNYVNYLLSKIEFIERLYRPTVSFTQEKLYNCIYNSVISGIQPDNILIVCNEFLNLDDYAFCQLAVEHILCYREPTVNEQQAFILVVLKLLAIDDIEGVIKLVDDVKNISLKKIAILPFTEYIYRLYLSNKPVDYFLELADKTRYYEFQKIFLRVVNIISQEKGDNLQLNANGQLLSTNLIADSKINQAEKELENTQLLSLDEMGKLLVNTLADFQVDATFEGCKSGPTFNRIEVKLGKGVKFSSVANLGEDLMQQLGSFLGIKVPPMVSVLPGRCAFDLPRVDRQKAYFWDYVDFESEIDPCTISIPGGVDVNGEYFDIALTSENVTHILGGGRTRSGKSQFEKAVILYLARRYPPSVVRLALSDVKRVTFSKFDQLPHLVAPVCKDARSTADLLDYLVVEMELRYQELETHKCETIKEFNFKSFSTSGVIMPRVVCVIDECFDLLSDEAYADRIKKALMKLLAKAGGVGIHLFLYTQRPDKNVIDPLIRSNFPAKTAFATTRPEDSCIILGDKDTRAANLLGHGDFLYKVADEQTMRLQALYVADEEKPEYFQQLISEAINQQDPYEEWDSGLDFVEFVNKLYLNQNVAQKASIDIDEQQKNSILSLHKRGYALDEIIKSVFGKSRHDGRIYKKIRNAVEDFINESNN